MAISGTLSSRFLSMTHFTLPFSRGLNARIIPAFTSARCAIASAATKKPATEAATTKTAAKPAAKATTKKKVATNAARTAAAKKKVVARKPATKQAAMKKTAVKKPVAKKKSAGKKRPVAKKPVLTDVQKKNKLIRELKVKALNPPPSGHHNSGYVLWISEQPISGRADVVLPELGAKWSAFPQEVKDTYNTKAIQARKSLQEAFAQWVKSQPVLTIYQANLARRRLRSLGVKGMLQIPDDRYPKRPLSSFFLYCQEQKGSGRIFHDGEGKRDIVGVAKQLGNEYLNLPAEEKKRLLDMATENRNRYTAELAKVSKEE